MKIDQTDPPSDVGISKLLELTTIVKTLFIGTNGPIVYSKDCEFPP